jgi:hypothetical protein
MSTRPLLALLWPTAVFALIIALPAVFAWLGRNTPNGYYQAQLGAAQALAGPSYLWLTAAGALLWLVLAWQWRWSVWRRLCAAPKRDPVPGELALTRSDRPPAWPHTVLLERGGVRLVQRTP